CRGWIREQLFTKLGIPSHRLYQFRLAMEGLQAKGCFKVMEDEIADSAGADIILPTSSIKPKIQLGPTDTTQWAIRLSHPTLHARLFQGPLVVGIRDYSRKNMEYRSSYTLIQHVPGESLDKEVIPRARIAIQQVIKKAQEGDYSLLLEQIGSSVSQKRV